MIAFFGGKYSSFFNHTAVLQGLPPTHQAAQGIPRDGAKSAEQRTSAAVKTKTGTVTFL